MVLYGGATYRYVHSLQGDILGLQDSAGNLVVEYRYDAWGRQVGKTGSLANSLGTLNPFRYRGYVYDDEIGLYYLRSRYYNPDWCRFISSDSILGHVGGLLQHNLFAYCCNTPVIHVDMDGKIMGMVEGENGGMGGPRLYADSPDVSVVGGYFPNETYLQRYSAQIWRTVIAFILCTEMNVGFGVGYGGTNNGVGACANFDIIAMKIHNGDIEFGMSGYYGVSLGYGAFNLGSTKSFWQPFYKVGVPFFSENTIQMESELALDSSVEFDVSLSDMHYSLRRYKLVGFSLSMSFNEALFGSYCKSIWGE